MGHSFTIAKKEVKLLFKARRRILLFFTVPILLFVLAILTIAISGLMIVTQSPSTPIVITVVDHAQNNDTLYIIQNLNASGFNIDNQSSVTNVKDLLTSQNPPDVLLYFPSNFTSLLANKNDTAMFYVYYNNKEIKYEAALTVIDYFARSLNQRVVNQDYGQLNLDRVNYTSTGISTGVSASQASTLIIIPIYVLMFFIIPPISLILISITQEREQKTLESLLLQPVSRKAIVNGKILYGLILVASNLIITIATILILGLGFIYLVNTFLHINFMNLIAPLITTQNILFVLYIIAGLALVSVLLISLAVMMSLLAKDEREGNMVVSILMILPVVALILIIAIPYNIFGFNGEIFLASLPVIGFMWSLYVTILTGSIGIISYISLIAQTLFCLLSIWFSSRLIEIEGILEINIVRALKKLVRLA